MAETRTELTAEQVSMLLQIINKGAYAGGEQVEKIKAIAASGYNWRLVSDGDASNAMRFYAVNTEFLRFNPNAGAVILMPSSGNVGIGTTSPEQKLHVVT